MSDNKYFIKSGTSLSAEDYFTWTTNSTNSTGIFKLPTEHYTVEIDGQFLNITVEDYQRALSIGYKQVLKEKEYKQEFDELIKNEK